MPAFLLPIFNFFTGVGGKIIMILAIVGIIFFGLYTYRKDIRAAVYSQFYADEVLAQSKKQQDTIESLTDQLKSQNDIIEQTANDKAVVQRKLDSVRSTMAGSKAQDGVLAPILRETIDNLRQKLKEAGLSADGTHP